jgi:hypothetical protein
MRLQRRGQGQRPREAALQKKAEVLAIAIFPSVVMEDAQAEPPRLVGLLAVENTFLRPAIVLPAAGGGGCLQPVGKVVLPEVDQKGVNGLEEAMFFFQANAFFIVFAKKKNFIYRMPF